MLNITALFWVPVTSLITSPFVLHFRPVARHLCLPFFSSLPPSSNNGLGASTPPKPRNCFACPFRPSAKSQKVVHGICTPAASLRLPSKSPFPPIPISNKEHRTSPANPKSREKSRMRESVPGTHRLLTLSPGEIVRSSHAMMNVTQRKKLAGDTGTAGCG